MFRTIAATCLICVAANATLVVDIQTPNGVVLCADRRVSIPKQGYVDKNIKLFLLGPACAYAITGTLSFFDAKPPNQLVVTFSVNRITEQYFRNHPCSAGLVDAQALSSYLLTNISDYLAQSRRSLDMETHVIVWHTTFGQLFRVDCEINQDNNGIHANCSEKTVQDAHYLAEAAADGSRLLIMVGDTGAMQRTYQSTAFAALQQRPVTRELLNKVLKRNMWTISDAEHLGRLMIREASKVILPGEHFSSISPECDCIAINPTQIVWLNKPIAKTLIGRLE